MSGHVCCVKTRTTCTKSQVPCCFSLEFAFRAEETFYRFTHTSLHRCYTVSFSIHDLYMFYSDRFVDAFPHNKKKCYEAKFFVDGDSRLITMNDSAGRSKPLGAQTHTHREWCKMQNFVIRLPNKFCCVRLYWAAIDRRIFTNAHAHRQRKSGNVGETDELTKNACQTFVGYSILGDVFFALHILYSGRRCPNTNHHYAYQEHRSNDGSRPILCHSAVDVV